jgi:hypothetical protein
MQKVMNALVLVVLVFGFARVDRMVQSVVLEISLQCHRYVLLRVLFLVQELSQIQGLSLISCKEPLQGSMLEKMIGLRVLILHDTLIKGYCTKVLSQLQFFYWGKNLVARDVRVPFQMGRLRKLETLILRANDIDLAMKVPDQILSI